MKKLLVTSLICGSLLMISGCGASQPVVQSGDTHMTIVSQDVDLVSVSGKAEVKVVPDKASIAVGVEVRHNTAEEASTELGNKSDTIIKALKESGVDDKDIKTDYYSVDLDYYWGDNGRVPTGYIGSCSLSVSGIDIDNIERIIDLAMNSGADSIGSIRYYSSEYKENYDKALSEAIEAAYDKAVAMGETAGFTVVRVHNLTEGYQDTSSKYISNVTMDAMEIEGFSSGTTASVSAGELTIEARVEVEYVIE